mgnify:FL=1
MFLLIVSICAQTAHSQSKAEPDAAKEAERIRKEAVAFLRETSSDVANMRTLENRISFASEMAALMWFHDDREARSMYGAVVADFKTLLAQYDAQMNALDLAGESASTITAGSFVPEASERTKAMRKFRTASAVRQQIAMSIAEHAPELAFNFYHDSLSLITNAEFRKQMESGDEYFGYRLMTKIAENDASRAVELGKASIGKGLNFNHIELLKTIYAKDVDKGVEFGAKVLSEFKSAPSEKLNDSVTLLLFDFAKTNLEESKKGEGKKPVYSENEVREIGEILAKQILSPAELWDPHTALRYAASIESILPGRAEQIRAKFKIPETEGQSRGRFRSTSGRAVPPPPVAAVEPPDPKEKEKQRAEEKLIQEVASIGTKPLPKEERERIVGEARRLLAQEPVRERKLMGLSALAAGVKRAGDAELAAELMVEASKLVNPQPKNYQDFIFTWLLISGYAEADPDNAFKTLDGAIYRANDLISAFVKVGEFIDVGEEMFVDGEMQVGAFGGEMIRGLTKEIGIAESTIKSLVRADFARTRILTDRFDRPEVRVLAKVLVLRAVLGKSAEQKQRSDSPESVLGTSPQAERSDQK